MPAPTSVKLTHEELEQLIDREARRRLKKTARQFRAYWARGALRDSVAAEEIAMLLRLDGQDGTA